MRSALLSGAVRFWARSAQWILITFDKLLQYRIVEPADIISFIFSPPTASEVPAVVLGSSGDHVPNSLSALGVAPGGTTRDWASMGWWDVVRMTVDKVNGRVDQLRARLESLEREEAEEREKRQAAEAAGADAVAEEKPAAPALPLFPTSASLPPKPGMAADEKPSASGKKGAGGTSEEARTALEAIRAEQRRVLVGTTRGFVEVVRQLDALAPAPLDPEERDEKGWQAWWVRAWYIEFGRLVSGSCALPSHYHHVWARVVVMLIMILLSARRNRSSTKT